MHAMVANYLTGPRIYKTRDVKKFTWLKSSYFFFLKEGENNQDRTGKVVGRVGCV